jgi:hypothetical protein
MTVTLRYWRYGTLVDNDWLYDTADQAMSGARYMIDYCDGVPEAILQDGELLYDSAQIEAAFRASWPREARPAAASSGVSSLAESVDQG